MICKSCGRYMIKQGDSYKCLYGKCYRFGIEVTSDWEIKGDTMTKTVTEHREIIYKDAEDATKLYADILSSLPPGGGSEEVLSGVKKLYSIAFDPDRILFTKEEIIELLKHLSRLEGAVMGSDLKTAVWEQFNYPTELLTKKLTEV